MLEHSQDVIHVLAWTVGALLTVLLGLIAWGVRKMENAISSNHGELVEAIKLIEETVRDLAGELRAIDNRLVAVEVRCGINHCPPYGRRATDLKRMEEIDGP